MFEKIKLLIATFILLLMAGTANASFFMVSVNNPSNTNLHEITVSPGDVFEIELNVTTTQDLIDIQTFLNASENNVFAISDGYYFSPWDTQSLPIPTGDLAPSSDWLYGSPGVDNVVVPGSWPFVTLDLTVAPSAPLGTYTLNVSPVWSSVGLNLPSLHDGDSGPDFIVHVVPEPTTLLLLGFGAVMLRRRRHKHNNDNRAC